MAGIAAPGAPAGPPLDQGLLRLIRVSAVQLSHLEDEFARQLQYDLAMLIPDLAGLRTADGWVFCQRMVQVLLWAAAAEQPAEVIAGALRQVGAANWLDGFPETQYVSVAHALVRTVRDLSLDDWSTSQGSAWISFFQWARPHLVSGARQAAAQQAGARQAAAQQAAAQQAAGAQPAPHAAEPPGTGWGRPSHATCASPGPNRRLERWTWNRWRPCSAPKTRRTRTRTWDTARSCSR